MDIILPVVSGSVSTWFIRYIYDLDDNGREGVNNLSYVSQREQTIFQ
jgi:hypothetical protein